MRGSLRFLTTVLLAASCWGCSGPDNVVLIDVMSVDSVSNLQMVVISREGLGVPWGPGSFPYPVPRTPESLEADPIRVAVNLLGPTTIIVHLTGTTPTGDTLIATRCYGVNGIITDQVVLAGPINVLDGDGDTFITDVDAACREPDQLGGTRACVETDLYLCDSMAGVDCDDMDENVFPGALVGPSQCQDGIDQDCDGDVDEACGDNDGDGIAACAPIPAPGCDCNDNDASINPRAEDICQDGIDQDCDGMDACCDADGDGFPQCRDDLGEITGDCVDSDADCARLGIMMSLCDPAGINPSAGEACDGIDNNCNLLTDEIDECRDPDLDGDGVATCGREDPGQPCEMGIYDCDAAIFPGARERCGNGIDEDLDGTVDEAGACPAGDMDGDGQIAPLDCDDDDDLAFTHRDERPDIDVCEDGVAQSCVPGGDQSCAADADGDGFIEPMACEGNAMISPLVMEVCNGVDDNCDGTINEVLDISMSTGCAEGMTITFDNDFGHCGECRNICDLVTADQCETGVCDCTAEGGAPAACTGIDPACCGVDGCHDRATDRDHCGECGRPCGSGETCVGGICQCGTLAAAGPGDQACPEMVGVVGEANRCCAGSCTDVRSDVDNCSRCGVVCGTDSVVCDDGVCTCNPASPNVRDCSSPRDLGLGGDGCETNTQTDIDHCGGCSMDCDPAHASGVCTGGSCLISMCDPTWDDCNSLPFDGCEGNLRSLTHCGSCGSGCSIPDASETCVTGTCQVASCASGFADCDTDGMSCETPLNTLSDCGSCGSTCDIANSSETCATERCRVTTCDSGWEDCDMNRRSCETDLATLTDCGSCGTACAIPNASESCMTETCLVVACSAGFDDCDMDNMSCETPLNTLTDCGSCSSGCSITNAVAECSTGSCLVASCTGNFGDCDMDSMSCETELITTTHCGGCGMGCAISNASEECSTGSCLVDMCDAGWGDCDMNMTSCETQLNDNMDCGSCGTTCIITNATESCASGSCIVTSCDSGWGDCDMDMTSCETQLNTVGNCGGCGTTCSIMNATEECSTGSCLVASCTGAFADCDMDMLSCETNTGNDELNCGGCGILCATGSMCMGGTCRCMGGSMQECTTDHGDNCVGGGMCECGAGMPACMPPTTTCGAGTCS